MIIIYSNIYTINIYMIKNSKNIEKQLHIVGISFLLNVL